MPGAELTLTEVGQVREDANRLRIDDRQYEGGDGLPFAIGCTTVADYSVKVVSNLKLEGATGEHHGVIDLEVWPGGHLTLEYRGAATVMVSGDNLNTWIASTGAFRTTAVRGKFVGLPADGVYWMHLTQEVGGPGSRSTLQLATSSGQQPWVWC
ncbi:MAG: hypothetical protein HY671_08865 [Chloroflexi bacterium]|nr:hypothetical protein [Chloroflexota bacterium]